MEDTSLELEISLGQWSRFGEAARKLSFRFLEERGDATSSTNPPNDRDPESFTTLIQNYQIIGATYKGNFMARLVIANTPCTYNSQI
jgi:hypothetical protein